MMQSAWRTQYSEFIHDTAVSWGFEEVPGRPLVGPYCDLYVKQPIPLLYEINYRNNAHIGIFQLNGLWGCEVKISMPTGVGIGYKSFLGFCKPHRTRQEAIAGAAEEILAYVHRDVPTTEDDRRCARRIDEWCKKLLLPQQLRMAIPE